jgi:hypothetical protein
MFLAFAGRGSSSDRAGTQARGLVALLKAMKPLEERFPEIDDA